MTVEAFPTKGPDKAPRSILEADFVNVTPDNIRARLDDSKDPIHGYIRKAVASVCSNAELRDDLTQDVSFKVWKYADKFKGNEDRLRGWIHTIAKRTFLDKIRANKVRHTDKLDSLDDLDEKGKSGKLSSSLSPTEDEMIDRIDEERM